jgi:Zn-dependent metalloprotease
MYGNFCLAQGKPFIVRNEDSGQYVKHIDFYKVPEKAPAFKLGELQMYTDSASFESLPSMRLLRQETDKDLTTHYHWQQTINNIPIENAVFTQHVKDGKVMSQSGSWLRSLNFKTQAAGITEKRALQFTLKYLNASKYSWQSRANALKFQEHE